MIQSIHTQRMALICSFVLEPDRFKRIFHHFIGSLISAESRLQKIWIVNKNQTQIEFHLEKNILNHWKIEETSIIRKSDILLDKPSQKVKRISVDNSVYIHK